MIKQFLEAGIVVNTHGVRGELKIQPWTDSPDFLTNFEYIYIDNNAYHVLSSRVHKNCVIVLFEGINNINEAMRLKNKTIYIDRNDITLPSGRFFLQDVFGLAVIDENGNEIGKVTDVLILPSGNVYDVRDGESSHLIPDSPEFILKLDIPNSQMIVHLIEGM